MHSVNVTTMPLRSAPTMCLVALLVLVSATLTPALAGGAPTIAVTGDFNYVQLLHAIMADIGGKTTSVLGYGIQGRFPLGDGRWQLGPFVSYYPGDAAVWLGGVDMVFNVVHSDRFAFYAAAGPSLYVFARKDASPLAQLFPDLRLGVEGSPVPPLSLMLELYFAGVRTGVGYRF